MQVVTIPVHEVANVQQIDVWARPKCLNQQFTADITNYSRWKQHTLPGTKISVDFLSSEMVVRCGIRKLAAFSDLSPDFLQGSKVKLCRVAHALQISKLDKTTCRSISLLTLSHTYQFIHPEAPHVCHWRIQLRCSSKVGQRPIQAEQAG